MPELDYREQPQATAAEQVVGIPPEDHRFPLEGRDGLLTKDASEWVATVIAVHQGGYRPLRARR